MWRVQTQVYFRICIIWCLCSVGALPNVWDHVCQDLVTDVRGSGAGCHVGRMPPRDGDKGDKGAPWTRWQGDKEAGGADVTQSKVRRWREVKSPALPGKKAGKWEFATSWQRCDNRSGNVTTFVNSEEARLSFQWEPVGGVGDPVGAARGWCCWRWWMGGKPWTRRARSRDTASLTRRTWPAPDATKGRAGWPHPRGAACWPRWRHNYFSSKTEQQIFLKKSKSEHIWMVILVAALGEGEWHVPVQAARDDGLSHGLLLFQQRWWENRTENKEYPKFHWLLLFQQRRCQRKSNP